MAVALLLLMLPGAAAQEPPQTRPVEEDTQPGAVPVLPSLEEIDPAIAIEELRIILRPLTAEELVDHAQRWQSILQDKQREVSATRLAARRAAGAERDTLNRTAAQLELERNALAERAEAVLRELEHKGGDPEAMRDYVGALAGADIDPADVSALWVQFQAWLVSPQGGVAVGINIVKFLVMTVVAFVLARIVGGITRRALRRVRGASKLLKEFLAGLVRKVVLVVGLVIALSFLGVNIGPLMAAIGAAGLVVGLALQGTLSNFASGIMILLYRPYDVGHVISAAGVSGQVQAMTLVSTTIVTFDNQRIIVPNNSIWGDVITNLTGLATRRVDMTFGVPYDADLDRIMGILKSIVDEHPLCMEEPPPLIKVVGHGDSSISVTCRPWCRTDDYWTVFWDFQKLVKQRFDQEGIAIPFPQRDVHVYHETPPKAA